MTGTRAALRADITALLEGERLSRPHLIARVAVHARWRATIAYRLAQRLFASPATRILGLWVSDRALAWSGAELHPASRLGPGLLLKHTGGLVVGGEVRAGERLVLHQNVTLGDRRPFGGQPTLGDDVTVAAGACILGPVRIGDRVTVAANAVVLDDVPDDCVVAGAPARIVRQRTEPAPTPEIPLRQAG